MTEDEKIQEKEPTTNVGELPKLSPLEETKAAIADLRKEREEITKIKDELNKLRSDQLLSGTGGIRQDPKPAEETDSAYRKRINKELAEGKTEFGN